MANSTNSDDLLDLVAELNRLAKAKYTPDKGFATPDAGRAFTSIVERLGVSARDPAENVYYVATRTAQSSAIRCAIELGIFQLMMQTSSSKSVDELAASSGAESLLVERLMRTLAGCGIFEQAGERLYQHNTLSRAFFDQNNRDMFQQMYDFVGKGAYVLPTFLKTTGWKNPEGYEQSAINLGLDISQGGFWEWLSADPARQALFNSGMQSRPGAINVAAFYNFEEQLNDGLKDDEVALVDIGGGRGHALIEIKQAFPGLRGRLVLQDQETVIRDAISQGLPDYIEPQAASFFESNPVRNARAYYYRRVFHDWSDPIAVKILSNTVSAMGPESRVLIADISMPLVGAPWSMVVQDLNMMVLGGIERTEEQWDSLLAKAGLVLTKIWRTEGSNHVLLESRLRGQATTI
ncbi:putative O-methyltransferase domain-containing protein [Seiridium unicorne]|uniref:O-methyltransferase domain-containing protein n=1 Tax=Seiridium unicorne TaxID=138068 RepID=A0ABR2UFY7_9PEZI